MYYIVLDACLAMYLLCDMIYGHGYSSRVMQVLHVIKNFKIPHFWLLHDPHFLQVVSEPIITLFTCSNVDICKCYEYKQC